VAKAITRKQLVVGAAVPLAAAPLMRASGAFGGDTERSATHEGHSHPATGHAAMIGDQAPAPDRNPAIDALLTPPASTPHRPGRVAEYQLLAFDREIEVARGVTFPAWTFNGTVPGPVIRATEDDLLRVRFQNGGSHPHTIHFHGIHPAKMDGVFEVVEPGGSFTYEFPARPYGMHLYHCHATPLKKHIHKGLYGAFIIDPPKPRKPAQELVMVLTATTSTASTGPPSTTRAIRSSSAARRRCGSTSPT
jgi:manganese oxidase